MFGIVLLLCTSCTSVFQYCIQFCISLAVGSLTGDALLHLLPMVGARFCITGVWSRQVCVLRLLSSLCVLVQFLGLHVHSDNEGGHHDHTQSPHTHQEEIPDYIYKMLVVMAGIYYFYLMETIFSLVTYKENRHHHQHHHAVSTEANSNTELAFFLLVIHRLFLLQS